MSIKDKPTRWKLNACLDGAYIAFLGICVGLGVFLFLSAALEVLVSVNRSERLTQEHEKRIAAIEEKLQHQAIHVGVARSAQPAQR